MKLIIGNNSLRVVRQPKDKKIPTKSGWNVQGDYDPNSQLFYKIVKLLREKGYDVIKKRMSKDGHLTTEYRQYIRSRNMNEPDSFCIIDSTWDIEWAVISYNENGMVTLDIIRSK